MNVQCVPIPSHDSRQTYLARNPVRRPIIDSKLKCWPKGCLNRWNWNSHPMGEFSSMRSTKNFQKAFSTGALPLRVISVPGGRCCKIATRVDKRGNGAEDDMTGRTAR